MTPQMKPEVMPLTEPEVTPLIKPKVMPCTEPEVSPQERRHRKRRERGAKLDAAEGVGRDAYGIAGGNAAEGTVRDIARSTEKVFCCLVGTKEGK